MDRGDLSETVRIEAESDGMGFFILRDSEHGTGTGDGFHPVAF
ncbi:MAG: hypothetical protein Ct9H300mP28_38050 [Pseudomonadota bacterium]|nr:MAG: hypothetical protein Ct9H300mP28_38050 [Pseudomonadota bacterium]